MALKKKIIKPNGLTLIYHRIAMVKIDTNQQTTILVHSYLNEASRQYEKDYANGLIEGEPVFPFVEAEYLTFEYSEDMNITNAYNWLKSQSKFEESEDV